MANNVYKIQEKITITESIPGFFFAGDKAIILCNKPEAHRNSYNWYKVKILKSDCIFVIPENYFKKSTSKQMEFEF